MAPPSLIDFVLSHDLADGVVVAGCAESACFNRLGIAWTEQRFAGAARSLSARARAARAHRHDLGVGARDRHGSRRNRGVRRRKSPAAAAAAALAAAGRAPSRPGDERDARRTWRADHDGSLRLAGQFVVIAALFAAVAAFSDWPAYRQIPAGSGIVMLTFVHGADRRAECRRLTPEEIAKLPPNMRRVQDCPRGRRPLYVELDLGGRTIYQRDLPPTGIAGDGPSRVYQRFVMPAGKYDVAVRMRDTPRAEGFDHERTGARRARADQMFVIDFRPESGEFMFR